MSAVPVIENADRRRIGDILLELGFATEQQLAEANVEQERTGQPLGQILVDHGAITRLELASALAEQWSDQSASISLLPVAKPAPRPVRQHDDDDHYAARLQDAVTDLARRVQATQPSDGQDDPRVTGLAERLEATIARAQRIEATLATLADSLAGVTGGVEEALAGLQSGMADLALELARVDSTVAEIVARPVVEDVGKDDAISSELESQRAMLAGLRAAVTELGARPESSPATDERLARIEARLAEGFASVPTSDTVAALAARIDATAAAQQGTVETVVELEQRLKKPTRLVAELAERVEALVDEHQAHASLAARVEALEAPAPPAEPDPRLDSLGDELAALRQELRQRVAAATPEFDPDVGHELARLAERVERLARESKEQRDLAVELNALEGQLHGQIVTSAALLVRLEGVEHRLASEVATPDALARAVDEVRAEVAGAAPAPSPDTFGLERALEAITERVAGLETLATRIDSLAEAVAAVPEQAAAPVVEDLREDIEARVATHVTGLKEELERKLEARLCEIEQPVRVDGASVPEGFEIDMERTRMAIERLSLQLGEHDRALAEMMRGRGIQQNVDELAARIDELAAGGSAGVGRGYADASDIRSLVRRIEGIEEETHEGRERLLNRLERMASSIDWRLQRLETGEPG